MGVTVEKIERIKVDCLYGKKKHFNAADRKERYHYRLGIPLIITNILTGSLLFKNIVSKQTGWLEYLPVGLAFVASFLTGFQTYFNFHKQVEGHRRIASRYLSIMKRLDRLQGYIADGLIKDTAFVKEMEAMAADIEKINKDAEQFPTSQKDYNKAQTGIEAGEEDYTERELTI
jgi:hypothetical protein